MPAVSKAQYRALQAASHGNSTLGIPASVGKEFVAATKNPTELPEKATTDEYHAHCTERCEHHRKMAQKAGSPASRALHRKLQAHFTNKLKAK